MTSNYASYLQFLAEQNAAMSVRFAALTPEQTANFDTLLQNALLYPNPSAPTFFSFESDALGGNVDTLPQFLTWFFEQNGVTQCYNVFDLRNLPLVNITFSPS